MSGKDLELALRIKADLAQGQKALEGLGVAVEGVGTKAETTNAQLGKIGESADQQAERIKAMVAASMQQQSALDATASSTQRVTAAVAASNVQWQQTAAAQSTAMNSYHDAERAKVAQAEAEKKATEEAAKATAEAGKQEAALNKLLGSISKTERELNKLDQQERELAAHFKAGRLDAEAYAGGLAKIEQRRNALKGIPTDAKAANTSLSGLATQIRTVQRLLLTGFAGYGLTSASRAIVNTNIQWQQSIHTMEAATGSAAKARQELEFVKDVSERLGLELLNTSQSYARLVAAAKESPELGKQIQGVFEGVASAATTLHMAPDQVNGVLLALEQMVSKGKVQTQELVLQLGQRVPGAFALAAKALDTNTAQLSQWLEQGKIAADEFLPRFGEALREAYGEQATKAAAGLQGQLNRLTNAFTDLKIQAGESGFIDSYTTAVTDLRDVLKDPTVMDGLNTLITALGQLIEFGAKGIGGAVSVVKFVGEEIAARMNGPAGDDVVRLEDAIARETLWMDKAQERLMAAYEANDEKLAAKIIASMTETQQNLQAWQAQIDAVMSPTSAPTITTPQPTVVTPRAKFVPTGGTEDKAAARLAKQNEDWVKQLEKEATTFGQGKAARREYELDQRNLSGALKARAQAAWATLDAAEKQKKADEQAKRDTKLLAQLQLDYLRATGQNVDAAGAEIEKKYGALQKRLAAAGNAEGSELVSKLMGIEKAKAELDDLEAALDRVFGEQSRRESSISTEQQAGLISELGARQQILNLNKSTAAEVEKLLPKMRELAAVTGDPAAIERVKDLEVRLVALRTVANEFTNALKAGFETGIQGALKGLADGTMSLQEAAQSFVQSIADSMVDLAAQQLSQMATSSLMGMFGGGVEADMTTGAAAVTGSAAALSTAGGTLLTGAAAIQAAATTLAAANGMSGASSAASAAPNSAASSGWFSSAASWAGSFFADGGHVRGPGTETSDSIPAWLSDYEFVTRAAVVTQPGALDFLHDFNARGMAALDDWSARVRHSTGGLAGVPAPALPAPSAPGGRLASPAAERSTTLKNSQTFNLIDSPERIAEVLNSPLGDQAFTVVLSRDPAKFRTILGI